MLIRVNASQTVLKVTEMEGSFLRLINGGDHQMAICYGESYCELCGILCAVARSHITLCSFVCFQFLHCLWLVTVTYRPLCKSYVLYCCSVFEEETLNYKGLAWEYLRCLIIV